MVTLMLAEVRGCTSESINCPEGTNNLKVWETLLYRNNDPKRYHQLTLRKKIVLRCLLCKHFLLRKHSKCQKTTTKLPKKDTIILLMVIQEAHRMQVNTIFLTFFTVFFCRFSSVLKFLHLQGGADQHWCLIFFFH